MAPAITGVELIPFSFVVEDVSIGALGGETTNVPDVPMYSPVYSPGEELQRQLLGIRIYTDIGIAGEYVGRGTQKIPEIRSICEYIIGKDPLKREQLWSAIKRGFRHYDRVGMGPVDIALWDFAGKRFDAPIHELLGTYRERLPAYASTLTGDQNGGLDSPEHYSEFAEECRDIGYPAFKIHTWDNLDDIDIEREIETVRAVGETVGDDMDLMLDPACMYETFADALEVGRVCDEYGFFWYEDPYRDGGISQHGHSQLRQRLETPLLQTEHIRGLEPHTDFIANEATDFVRADPDFDGGITGAMKIARVAEGFGLDVEYHVVGPATRHCMAATRNTNYYELGLVHPEVKNIHHPPIYEEYSDFLEVVDDNGTVPVPTGPGLGVDYDWSLIRDTALNNVIIGDAP